MLAWEIYHINVLYTYMRVCACMYLSVRKVRKANSAELRRIQKASGVSILQYTQTLYTHKYISCTWQSRNRPPPRRAHHIGYLIHFYFFSIQFSIYFGILLARSSFTNFPSPPFSSYQIWACLNDGALIGFILSRVRFTTKTNLPYMCHLNGNVDGNLINNILFYSLCFTRPWFTRISCSRIKCPYSDSIFLYNYTIANVPTMNGNFCKFLFTQRAIVRWSISDILW